MCDTEKSILKADRCCSRRGFLGRALGCSAFVGLGLSLAAPRVRAEFAAQVSGELTEKTAFARIEKLAEGVWAVISTPFTPEGVDGTTFSNGAIIAGRDGVLTLEGHATPAGSVWVSDAALALTGMRPTHVVLTHFHNDHAGGLAGHQLGAQAPAIIATATTRRLLIEDAQAELDQTLGDAKDTMVTTGKGLRLPETILVDDATPTVIDLGGRSVRLTCRKGHTPSDITVELDDPRIIFTGDLLFKGLFPYYGDALPSAWNQAIEDLAREAYTKYVPGHGSVAEHLWLADYQYLLSDVEQAAKRAHEQGKPAAEAWQEYKVPEALGEWKLFRPDVYLFAFEAWERELASN